jgi:hypothetical protein
MYTRERAQSDARVFTFLAKKSSGQPGMLEVVKKAMENKQLLLEGKMAGREEEQENGVDDSGNAALPMRVAEPVVKEKPTGTLALTLSHSHTLAHFVYRSFGNFGLTEAHQRIRSRKSGYGGRFQKRTREVGG